MPPSKGARKTGRVLVIHGPNLNLLGTREPNIYGKRSLVQINRMIEEEASSLGIEVSICQFNAEGDIVDAIQRAAGTFDVIVINPAAYTHTSVAIPDAIASTAIPAIEVHLSNIYSREEFRRKSFVAPVAAGQIAGFGPAGYLLAMRAACTVMDGNKRKSGPGRRER